jgi:hypothetical protein
MKNLNITISDEDFETLKSVVEEGIYYIKIIATVETHPKLPELCISFNELIPSTIEE